MQTIDYYSRLFFRSILLVFEVILWLPLQIVDVPNKRDRLIDIQNADNKPDMFSHDDPVFKHITVLVEKAAQDR